MNDLVEEIRTALYSVWHRRWIAIAVAWGVCLLGWLVVTMIPNQYESRARIFVDVDDVLSEQLGIAGDGRAEIARVRQTLVSTKNLKRVISATKLGDQVSEPWQMDNAVADLAGQVQVTSEQDNLFEIIATVGDSDLSDAENAVLARNVVQKLLDIFREEHISGNKAEIDKAIAELDSQLDERKTELEVAEQRRLAFEAQYPDLVGGSDTLSAKIQNARSELRDVDADLAAATSSLAALNGQMASTPRTLANAPAMGGPRAALSQAQQQLAELRGRGFKDNHPDVISTAKQVRLLEQQVADAGPDNAGGSPNPAYSSLLALRADRQASVDSLQARRAALQSQIASLMASQAASPEAAAEANRISRDYEVLRRNYEDRLQDREEIRTRGNVVDETSQYKFDLIDPPVVPQRPSAPNRPLLLLGVLVVGLATGAGTAYLLSQLRGGFATTQKLERAFGLPVIGAISLNLSDAAKDLRRLRLKQFAGACAGLAGVFVILLAIEFVSVVTVA